MVVGTKEPTALTPVVLVIVTPTTGFLFYNILKRDMTITKNLAGNLLPISVTEGVTVNVLPNERHEYLMTTKEVANGYGVSKYVVFKTMQRNSSELIEGKHYVLGVDILSTPGLTGVVQSNSFLFTKRGIVRLGFFIKSERAKLFRNWAEELIIRVDNQNDLFGKKPSPKLPEKRNYRGNRLNPSRVIRILALVNRIEENNLRVLLSNEITGGIDYGN